MAPQWISKTAHGRALEEGSRDMKGTTNSGQLAGAVLRRIQEVGEAVIHVAGPERTMTALRAAITAQRMLDAENAAEDAAEDAADSADSV
eukprot:Skav204226  [mRNA]  locus=scaffold1550:141736:143082:- [translate_table: standard]